MCWNPEPVVSPKPRAYPLRDHIGALVHEVARFRKAAFDRDYQSLGITRSQRLVLIYITQMEGKGVSQKDLAGMMKISPVSLGEKLGALERLDWIERRMDPADRRQRLLYLTTSGQAVLDASSSIARRLNARIVEALAPSDIDTAERVLRTMRDTLLHLNNGPDSDQSIGTGSGG
jgi:MarR family transcriptional regulator, transcriptional regulator for hemolysin